MPRVYLDHNATSPPRACAQAALRTAASECWANPASAHREGQSSRAWLETARSQVARLAGCDPAGVFFTSGGTEAGHAALCGAARAAGRRGTVVISGLEHACIRQAARRLAADGFSLAVVPPRPDGRVDAGEFLAACGENTVAAALISAHNEIGTLQPVDEVAAELARREIPLVCDGIQAVGRGARVLPAGENVLGLLSAHKFGGLAGAGAVMVHPDRLLVPHIGGGEQERGRRGGTPGLPLLAAMGAAAEEACDEAPEEGWRNVAALRDAFEERVLGCDAGIEILGREVPRLPNTTALLIAGVRGEDLVATLDLAGFAISSGSACSTGSSAPSESLLSMGLPPERARELARFSLGTGTTAEEMDGAFEALRRSLARRRAGGRGARQAGAALP